MSESKKFTAELRRTEGLERTLPALVVGFRDAPTGDGFVSLSLGEQNMGNVEFIFTPQSARAFAAALIAGADFAGGDVPAAADPAAMVELFADIREWLEDYMDTVDGPDGGVRPNRAMSFATEIDQLIGEHT